MQPRIREVLDYITAERAALEAAVAAVPGTMRDTAPAAGRWSVAEILEHLGVVERSVARLLTVKGDQARAAGIGQESSSEPVLPTAPVARLLDRSAPVVAPERVRPRGALDANAAWQALVESRQALVASIQSVDGLALEEIVAPHPVAGPLNLYQWIAFVGAHEARHAQQVREAGSVSALEP